MNSSQVTHFSGNHSDRSNTGFTQLQLNNGTSIAYSSFGGRLCFKNAEGVYVGNYLGYIESSKLRSKSGVLPTGDTTIGKFRTHVKNNN